MLISRLDFVSFVAWSIFFLPFTLFLRKYLRITKKDESLEKQAIYAKIQEINALVDQNRNEFLKYSQAIDEILMNRYHFKTSYRPTFIHNTKYYGHSPCDILLYKEGATPQQSAQIIFDEVVAQGDEFSPHIMQERFVKEKLGKFSKFNKVFFGSYFPTTKQFLMNFIIWVLLALTLYGLPKVFLGPNRNTFIPSQIMRDFWEPTNYALTGIMSLYFIFNKKFRDRISEKNGKWSIPLYLILLPLILLLLLNISLGLGATKLLNKIVGQEKDILYVVSKDLDTDKNVGRSGHVTAYCIKIKAPNVSFFEDEYCIKKEDYDLIPQNTDVVMKFHGFHSYFGYEIDGYYTGFITQSDIKSFGAVLDNA